MAHSRLAAVLLILCVPIAIRAQDLTEPSKKEQEELQKMQNRLNEEMLETKQFPPEMTLEAFVEAVGRKLTKDKRISLRIDKDAFGDNYAEVAATPMFVPPSLTKTSLRTRLDWAFPKSKTKFDYHIGANEITITTPQRALFTATYDISDLVSKPGIVGLTDPAFRNADQTKRATVLVKKMLTEFETFSVPAIDGEAIQVLNDTRLVVRTTGSRHAVFAPWIPLLTRLGDLAIITTTTLYEVGDADYTKLKNAKYVPIEELERIFLEGKTPKGPSLFDKLAKQKPILVGPEVKVDAGGKAVLLSRHDVIRCLPDPEQVIKGDKTRQAILEGVSFSALTTVSPDRRRVEMKFTEVSAVPEIRKVKVRENLLPEFGKGEPLKDVFAEVAVVTEATHSRVLEIPDCGTMLVPVHFRPRALQEKGRWWVLSISPRIYIEEEERMMKAGEKK